MEHEKIKNVLESLLLVAGRPMKIAELANFAGVSEEEVLKALEELVSVFSDRGINLIKLAHGYQLVTNPDNSEYVSRLLDAPKETYLTAPSLETLAIIAYKQPVTRAEVDAIRGVTSDSSIDTLLRRNMIEEKGRSDAVGRPIIYGTSEEFLKHFGLTDLSALPPLPENESIDQAIKNKEIILPEEIIADESAPAEEKVENEQDPSPSN